MSDEAAAIKKKNEKKITRTGNEMQTKSKRNNEKLLLWWWVQPCWSQGECEITQCLSDSLTPLLLLGLFVILHLTGVYLCTVCEPATRRLLFFIWFSAGISVSASFLFLPYFFPLLGKNSRLSLYKTLLRFLPQRFSHPPQCFSVLSLFLPYTTPPLLFWSDVTSPIIT